MWCWQMHHAMQRLYHINQQLCLPHIAANSLSNSLCHYNVQFYKFLVLSQRRPPFQYHPMPRRSVSNSRSNSPKVTRQRRSPAREQSPRRRSPPRRSDPQETSGEPKVYVSGLPANIRKEDLEEMFGKCGNISDLFVVNKDNFSFAFVLYDDHSAAQEAINTLNGESVKGKSIKCALARPRPPRNNDGPRGGGDGNRGKGCFKCGQEGHFARECTNPPEQGNNRGPPRRQNDRNNFRNKSEDQRTGSPKPRANRKRSVSRSGSPALKKRESPVKRRNASPSSSHSNPKNRGGKRSRSRSVELRKGKKRVSSSSHSR